jgi:hypothetical protein
MATTFTLTAPDGTDRTAEISGFAEMIGLDHAAPGRCSLLLTLGLFGGFKSGHVDPAKVVHEIRALEGVGRPSQLKPPIQNKHPPLKGLWHKHYQDVKRRPIGTPDRRRKGTPSTPAFAIARRRSAKPLAERSA